MDIRIKRTKANENGVFGEMYDSEGNLIAFTIEHSYDGEPKVPVGSYVCFRRFSPKFQMETFCLREVPGHENILIHKGNTQKDSDGCFLIGSALQNDYLLRSKEAFDKFMKMQEGLEEFNLIVE